MNDSDPTAKIPAIKISADTDNTRSIPLLVEDLDSDDPAIRFYAIKALQDLTGETFGYRYFDDDLERRDALKRWNDWLAEQSSSSTQPTTQPATDLPPTAAAL